ncbi:MAG TPA: NAD-dependent epimerase/dehydratase family protein [Caldilineaceae bacterium]|nr:NAD-dependent epimerase/dehydratase family protein [Caldilineaceae bacterium]
MTTFVTGGTSILGRLLVQELVRQGDAVRVLVRPTSNRAGLELPGVEFIRGDINDVVAVRKGITGCDRVCHVAELGVQAAEADLWRVNRDGTRNVLQAALDLRVASVVQVSSLAALGPTQIHTHPDEGANERHSAPAGRVYALYQATRRAADDLAREYALKGLPIKLVYAGFGYGCVRHAPPSSLTEQTLLRLASGKPALVVGSGRTRIAATYYKDIVQGILLAHSRGQAGEGYILSGASATLPQIWAVVSEVLDKPAPLRRLPLWLARSASSLVQTTTGHAPFPADFLAMAARDWHFSSEKATRALGWRPRSLREGMAEAWEEFQALGFGRAAQRTPVRAMPRA